jgi:hypothetical protein
MADRKLTLPAAEQSPLLKYRIARSAQTELYCFICGKLVDLNTSRADAATKTMHEECYVLRQMLQQSTTPTNHPRA